jgi:hypothetical protein
MMSRYRLTATIPAIYHAPEGAEIADLRVTLPAGAALIESVVYPLSSGWSMCTGRGDTIPSIEGICSRRQN